MMRHVLLILLTSSRALPQKPAQEPIAVARRFLPPNSQLAEEYEFDFKAGHVSRRWPAVLTGHILEPESQDIVFAYYTPRNIRTPDEKTLFLALLHQTREGYEEVYEVSYRFQVLLIPRALRLLHLNGVPTDAVAVVAGVGASLGGHLHVFVWRNQQGWEDVFPPNSTGYTYFFPMQCGLTVALSSARNPGLNVTPTPKWFRWKGKRFEEVPPPEGSARWPVSE
jgi:hypothetical protein